MANMKHPLWRKWTWIRQVILNPTCPKHQPGLKCVGLDNFQEFRDFVRKEIGRAPPNRQILNRLRKDEGWVPGNISWANQSEVAKSSDFSYQITYKRRTYFAYEFARLLGIDASTLSSKLRKGRSIEDISGLKGVSVRYGPKT